MTQEEEQLLLKDLCARLPYGVIINKKVCHSHRIEELIDIGYGQKSNEVYVNGYPIKQSRPYLRPMSSMTEEEKNVYVNTFLAMWDAVDWLNEHHFDYRGLIEKGLALEAPSDMYKTE